MQTPGTRAGARVEEQMGRGHGACVSQSVTRWSDESQGAAGCLGASQGRFPSCPLVLHCPCLSRAVLKQQSSLCCETELCKWVPQHVRKNRSHGSLNRKEMCK